MSFPASCIACPPGPSAAIHQQLVTPLRHETIGPHRDDVARRCEALIESQMHRRTAAQTGSVFRYADEAAAFRAELVVYGAVKPNRKLPWRYRWPDDVRDDVLARLLALNAERYAEEVAQWLHGKVKATPAATPAPVAAAASAPAPAPRGRRRRNNPDQTDLLGGAAG